MAKKQVAEKELEAKKAELQGADARLTEKETIESEADSVSIEQIKSSLATPDKDFDWDADDNFFVKYSY
jgi:small subunit ribosomal protein S1